MRRNTAEPTDDEALVEIADWIHQTATLGARSPDRAVFTIAYGDAHFRATRFHDLGELWYRIRRPLIPDINVYGGDKLGQWSAGGDAGVGGVKAI